MLSALLTADTCGFAVGTEDRRDTTDHSFLLSMGAVVMSMQGGFALLEAGGVRYTNAVNIMMKNISDLCIGAVVFWACGWAFAYGGASGSNSFIGIGEFFSTGTNDVVNWFFQFSFAATAATIDSGAVAERIQFIPYLGLSAFMTAWTYPVVAHWVWGGGLLSEIGFVDFAGSGVVHLTGGCSALVAAWWIGPRTGRFTNSKHKHARLRQDLEATGFDAAHEESFQASDANEQLFGTFLLWTGWYGFNCGSILSLAGGGDVSAGHVAITTTVAAGAGGCTGMIISYFKSGFISVADLSNGILGGLVAITAQCHLVEEWHAFVIGATASVLVHYSVKLVDRLEIDDPVSAVSIHGVAGIYGLLTTGLFATNTHCGVDATTTGLFYSGEGTLLWIQTRGALAILGWSMGNTILFMAFLQYVLRINPRVPLVDEMIGMDLVEHGVDQGERMLQYIRNMHLTMSTLEPDERRVIRSVIHAFLDPEEVFMKQQQARLESKDNHVVDVGSSTGSSSMAQLNGLTRKVKASGPGPEDFIRHQSLRDMLVMAKATAEDPRMPESVREHARRSSVSIIGEIEKQNDYILSGVGGQVMMTSLRDGPANPKQSLLAARATASCELITGGDLHPARVIPKGQTNARSTNDTGMPTRSSHYEIALPGMTDT